ASNLGGDAVSGATVHDHFDPAVVTSVDWTCTASGGASCGATSGSGDIAVLVSLPTGGQATFSATATLGGTDGGTLSNTATIDVPSGVIDGTTANNSATDVDTLAITNHTPTADAGGPYNVDEGGSTTLTGSGTDPDGDPLSYAWDLDNNGSFESSGKSVTFSAANSDGPSSQPVALQVCDDSHACNTATTAVSVAN